MKQYVESLQEALAREVEKHECLWRWHTTYWQTSCGHRTDNFNSGRCPYCYQTLVQTPTVHPLLIDLPKLEFNTEKAIAEAIMDALKMHEESGDGETGQYSKTMEECLLRTCAIHSLTGNMWALLGLAMHWINDVQGWCDDVMAGRSVMDSYIKCPDGKAEFNLCDTCRYDFGSCNSNPRFADADESNDAVVSCETYEKDKNYPEKRINLCDTCRFHATECDGTAERETVGDDVFRCEKYEAEAPGPGVDLCDTCEFDFDSCAAEGQFQNGTGVKIISCKKYKVVTNEDQGTEIQAKR